MPVGRRAENGGNLLSPPPIGRRCGLASSTYRGTLTTKLGPAERSACSGDDTHSPGRMRYSGQRVGSLELSQSCWAADHVG